jgi:hypothetical protein
MNDKRKFAENAANGIMIWPRRISRWTGRVKLTDAARKAAREAGANPDCFNGYFALLGKFHSRLKEVLAAYAKVRTVYDRHTFHLSADTSDRNKVGDRGVIVAHYPAALAEVQEYADKAAMALEAFLADYERFVDIAKAEDLGDWKREAAAKYPTVEELRSKFRVELGTPRPLPTYSSERMARMNLPADYVIKIAEQGEAETLGQLEVAKAQVMGLAEKTMLRIEKQLSNGTRFHQSMIDDAKHHAKMLRGITEAYDNDPRLIALAEEIEDKIVAVGNVEKWKSSDTQKAVSLKAAQTVAAGLGTLAAIPTSVPPKPKAQRKTGKLVAGGIMGKAKAKSTA